MSTVIIGGGIIGASIAFYLSNDSASNEQQPIHVIESSSHPFTGASGYAAGFLAKDWFAPALAPLGAYSFELHKQLAAEFDGNRKWGYMPGTALSLDVTAASIADNASTGYDWLRDGGSRALASTVSQQRGQDGESNPLWLTKQRGGRVEVISGEETVAQVRTPRDPSRLCHFLHETTLARDVQWHHPAQVVSVTTDASTHAVSSVTVLNSSTQTEYTLPCRNLVMCAGPWTTLVYKSLFPSASVQPHISPLAGYSLLVRSPRHTLLHEHDKYKGRSHAVFTTLPEGEGGEENGENGFSPEIFSREGAEIYIAGLNFSNLPLPTRAEGSKAVMDAQKMAQLKKVAVQFLGKLAEDDNNDGVSTNVDDLEILREALCFRPVSDTGLPIVSRVKEEYLGHQHQAGSRSAVGRNIGGVFVATGHGPWGISQSLGTGKVVADMVDGIEPAVDPSLKHNIPFASQPTMANTMYEGGYNDSNRAFLQAFMARSTMTFEDARPVLAAIFTAQEGREVLAEDITQADLNSYIAAANSAISPFDLEIRSTKPQIAVSLPNGAQTVSSSNNPPLVYALVNTTSDPLTQLATTYSVDEIAFVKRLLDAMFETYNTRRLEAMVVSSMQAIQLAKASSENNANRRESTNNAATNQGGAAQSLTMTQAESMLGRLVEEGWFEKSSKGFYSLSPRGLMELRGWLVETYNDEDEHGHRARRIKFCAACKDIITAGQRCSNRECLGRLHDTCVRNFFRMQQAERCPVCKIEWPGDKFVGERAITTSERYMQGRRRSQSQNTQAANQQNDSEDEDGDS
ncbi:hypothetical protein UA08_02146 [Talaromyces atroroseus]|uniref:Non-structural maintenance of chromosomes element 1 homolog n=1 Tax=Talaromyces atroroseus TaxID=1441469 RepID=A0A225B5F8_TALAT|nr:hypothetical protein UA08_02146 [Talaromyces atroroseus]OKL62105.1 hypothetical protein UA08_02146 [Talaromyces atroroseus]